MSLKEKGGYKYYVTPEGVEGVQMIFYSRNGRGTKFTPGGGRRGQGEKLYQGFHPDWWRGGNNFVLQEVGNKTI